MPSHPPSSEPPSFVTMPESQTALPNATVRFKCTFQGTPPFTIKWFKNDTELMTGPTCFTGQDGLSCFLELYSLVVVQSGVYSCQVSNEAGSVRCSADLTIKGWTSSSSLHIFFAVYVNRKQICFLALLPLFISAVFLSAFIGLMVSLMYLPTVLYVIRLYCAIPMLLLHLLTNVSTDAYTHQLLTSSHAFRS